MYSSFCLSQPNNLKFKKSVHTQVTLLAQTAELLVSSVIACLQLKTYNLLKSKIEGPDSKTTENVVFTKTNAKNRLFSVQKLTIDRDRTNWHPRKRFSYSWINSKKSILEFLFIKKGYFSHFKSVYKLEISWNMVIKEIYLRCTMP